MPGPLKANPANTTGLLITKAGAAFRPASNLQPPVRSGDTEFDSYVESLHKEITQLRTDVEVLTQKLNRMQVDPVTKIVTFIA